MKEDAFRAHVIKKLRARGGEWFIYPRTRFAKAGVADVIGCYRGRFVAIELKRPDGQGSYGATQTQLAFIERVIKNKGVAVVAASYDVIEVALQRIDAEEDGLCLK